MCKKVVDRFVEYMNYAGLNDNKVTVQAGLSIGILGKAKASSHDLSAGNISKLLYVYKDINARWLLTGEGEMLQNDVCSSVNNDNLTTYIMNENKELKTKNEQLNYELGKLEGQIIELKKRVPVEDAAKCAIVSGTDLVTESM